MVVPATGGSVVSAGIQEASRRRWGGWLALRTCLTLLGVIGGAALIAIAVDAVIDLPESGRVVAPWLLGAGGLLVLALSVRQWRRLGEQRLALLFEGIQPSLGNQLINAVQLSKCSSSTVVEEFLRLESMELGRQAASGVAVWPAVRQGVGFAAGAAGVAMVAWLCLLVFCGEILSAVAPRFLDPHGDHPPYSRTKIEVTPDKADVLYGGQTEIRAKVSSGGADKLWLVAKSGANVTRTIMFLAPDKSFFQTLANLRESVEYYVTDGRARSHRFPIGIRYTPQITLVEVTTTFPEYTGKPAHTGRLNDEPQALPEDTKLCVRVASNRPLKSGRLDAHTRARRCKQTQITLKPEGQSNIVSGAVHARRGDGVLPVRARRERPGIRRIEARPF